MKSYYIKGTSKRYSIREDGNVVAHWRYQNNGKKRYSDKILSKHFNTKKRTKYYSPVVNLKFGEVKAKTVFVFSLMVEYFKLNPPDKHHEYRMSCKDGDSFNNSVDNLQWEIKIVREYEYQPKAIHKDGKIVSKICGCCGENRDIVNYTLASNPNHKGAKATKYTFRNICELCRSSEQWDRIMNNPESLKLYQANRKKWATSKEGVKYYKDYVKKNYKKPVVELQDCYVRRKAVQRGFNKENITPEMVDAFRVMLQIKRESRNL